MKKGFAHERPILKPLSNKGLEAIKETSLKLLENTGIGIEDSEIRNSLKKSGATIANSGLKVKIPKKLVEDSLDQAPEVVTYGGREPEFDLILAPNGETYSRTIGGAEGYIDLESREYRKPNIDDVRDWARLADALENISYCASIYPDDIHAEIRDIHLTKLLLENTRKHIEVQPYGRINLQYMIDLSLAIQSKSELKKKPIISCLTSSTSPLQFSKYATDNITLAGQYGIPIELNTMPQAGATGPITISGMLVLTHAEILAGITIAQVANPGAPIVYRPLAMVMEMSKGEVSLAATIENAMIAAAGAQLAREHCAIPTNMAGQVTDALYPDEQSMIERTINTLLPALAGANVISGAGQVEHWATGDLVQMVIDNEILGMVYRMVHGFEINEETLALGSIKRAGVGGNYLTDPITLKFFKTEYYFSQILNRLSRETWQKEGKPTFAEKAREEVHDILKEHEVPSLSRSQVNEMTSIIQSAEADDSITGE